MSDVTTLFATRAERFPVPTDSDAAYKAAEKLLEQIPAVGPIITYVATNFLGPSFERRREEWWRELASALEELETKVEKGFSVSVAYQREELITATYQATRAAITEHQKAKRQLLRNALLNIALERAPSNDLQQVYLRMLEGFTVSHVLVLKTLYEAVSRTVQINGQLPHHLSVRDALAMLCPELTLTDGLYGIIRQDLQRYGLCSCPPLDGSALGHYLTNEGISFLQFLAEPVELAD